MQKLIFVCHCNPPPVDKICYSPFASPYASTFPSQHFLRQLYQYIFCKSVFLTPTHFILPPHLGHCGLTEINPANLCQNSRKSRNHLNILFLPLVSCLFKKDKSLEYLSFNNEH